MWIKKLVKSITPLTTKTQFLSTRTYENPATINYFSTKKASSKSRTIENEGGREFKSIFLYGKIDWKWYWFFSIPEMQANHPEFFLINPNSFDWTQGEEAGGRAGLKPRWECPRRFWKHSLSPLCWWIICWIFSRTSSTSFFWNRSKTF